VELCFNTVVVPRGVEMHILDGWSIFREFWGGILSVSVVMTLVILGSAAGLSGLCEYLHYGEVTRP
jgi:hypothetical protein